MSMGVILLLHIGLLWVHGQVLIMENNRVVLGVETALGLGILLLGLERLVNSSRR